MGRRRKKPKLYKCKVINPPSTKEEQEAYDEIHSEALARLLYYSLEPEEIDQIIRQLRTEQA